MLIEREERLRWRRNKSREREKRGQVTDQRTVREADVMYERDRMDRSTEEKKEGERKMKEKGKMMPGREKGRQTKHDHDRRWKER